MKDFINGILFFVNRNLANTDVLVLLKKISQMIPSYSSSKLYTIAFQRQNMFGTKVKIISL